MHSPRPGQEEARLFEYPDFTMLQLGLDDGVQFTHRGRTREKMGAARMAA